MNRPTDVIEMLRQANPVPPGSVDDVMFPTVAELRTTWRSLPIDRAPEVWDPGTVDRPRRWPMYAATAALAAGVVALLLVPPDLDEPVQPVTTPTITTVPEERVVPDTTTTIAIESRFVGMWVSSDSDGSFQTMEILGTDGDEFELIVRDDYATVCRGASSTTTGTGRLQTVDTLVFPQPVLTCDDGTTAEIDGAPLGAELVDRMANLTFVRDPESDELADSLDVSWRRATFDAAGSPTPPEGSPAAARAIVSQLVDALTAAAADDSLDETSLPDVFTPDATISAYQGWGDRPVNEPGLLGTWIAHLQTWGFEASGTLCEPDGERVNCTVRARWQTVSAEADETWTVALAGERIQTLIVVSDGQRFGDPVLPISLAELDDWENWLQDTDPETADRLLTPAAPESPLPLVPRYDPGLASEVAASIRQYIEQRPPGDEIAVTPDMIDLGDRLVGLVGAVARADSRTYVLAGRYETEADRFYPPETAVLAAFNEAGTELWRTDLGGSPRHLEAVDGDLWVTDGDTNLSRIDASNGDVLDVVNVGEVFATTGAFGSVWIQILGPTEGETQLIRVAPDLSITKVELPNVDTRDLVPSAPTEGAGAMWVPLGDGGVARIDPETMEMTVMTAEEIGHDVIFLVFDEDVAYAASRSEVTSIVDGQVRATASTDDIWYLGPIGDSFGALGPSGLFVELTADEPMLGEVRQVSPAGQLGIVSEIDGEAWVETGENFELRRVELVPSGEG